METLLDFLDCIAVPFCLFYRVPLPTIGGSTGKSVLLLFDHGEKAVRKTNYRDCMSRGMTVGMVFIIIVIALITILA